MLINFTKMHGLGNDFVVIDAMSRPVVLTRDQLRFIADRHFGIGCDQILLVEAPTLPGVDFRYRIYNADGGEVEQCGNGVRCFARFVLDKHLTTRHDIRVETQAGLISAQVETNGDVTVNMGTPRFVPADIPFVPGDTNLQRMPANRYMLDVAGQRIEIGAVSMGNPHAVVRVDNVDTAPVATLGPQIEQHASFPRRVNAGFMQVIDRSHIRLRVYERGVGETRACGTGACAAVVIGRQQGLLDEAVSVDLPGGTLIIRWAGRPSAVNAGMHESGRWAGRPSAVNAGMHESGRWAGRGKESEASPEESMAPVWMTGPAVSVFEGKIEL